MVPPLWDHRSIVLYWGPTVVKDESPGVVPWLCVLFSLCSHQSFSHCQSYLPSHHALLIFSLSLRPSAIVSVFFAKDSGTSGPSIMYFHDELLINHRLVSPLVKCTCLVCLCLSELAYLYALCMYSFV